MWNCKESFNFGDNHVFNSGLIYTVEVEEGVSFGRVHCVGVWKAFISLQYWSKSEVGEREGWVQYSECRLKVGIKFGPVSDTQET